MCLTRVEEKGGVGVGQSKMVPPYVTFNNFLQVLDFIDKHRPAYVRKELFPDQFADSLKPRIIQTLKFFNLIDLDGKADEKLFELSAGAKRKTVLSELLKQFYPQIIEKNLENISAEQLEQAIRAFGINGTTCRRASQFFLQAAKYAGFSINPDIDKPIGRRIVREYHSETKARPKESANEEQGDTFTLKLSSGGSVTLKVDLPVFQLNKHDRDFVFELIDRLKEYEENTKQE